LEKTLLSGPATDDGLGVDEEGGDGPHTGVLALEGSSSHVTLLGELEELGDSSASVPVGEPVTGLELVMGDTVVPSALELAPLLHVEATEVLGGGGVEGSFCFGHGDVVLCDVGDVDEKDGREMGVRRTDPPPGGVPPSVEVVE